MPLCFRSAPACRARRPVSSCARAESARALRWRAPGDIGVGQRVGERVQLGEAKRGRRRGDQPERLDSIPPPTPATVAREPHAAATGCRCGDAANATQPSRISADAQAAGDDSDERDSPRQGGHERRIGEKCRRHPCCRHLEEKSGAHADSQPGHDGSWDDDRVFPCRSNAAEAARSYGAIARRTRRSGPTRSAPAK